MTRTVCQVLADFGNLSDRVAEKLCNDFKDAGIDVDPSRPAEDCQEFIVSMNELLSCNIMRRTVLGSEEIDESTGEEGNIFFYNVKIKEEDIDKYLFPISEDSENVCSENVCSICLEENVSNSVYLSCSIGRNKSTCRFCRGCITQWLTQCCARCPNCRTFVQEIDNEKKIEHIRKIIITVRPKSS
jgi:hypothetical protein